MGDDRWLDITADDIGRDRDRLVLARIEAKMLWPNDLAQRERALAAARACNYRQRVSAGAAAMPPTSADLAELLDWMQAVPPIDEVRNETRVPFARGLIAGMILL